MNHQSIHNAPYNHARTALTPALQARIIELKLAKVCSVDIREQLGLTSSQIDRVWIAHRKANPTVPAVGTGTHAHRRPQGVQP